MGSYLPSYGYFALASRLPDRRCGISYGVSLDNPGAAEHSNADRQSYKRRPHDLTSLSYAWERARPVFTDGTR